MSMVPLSAKPRAPATKGQLNQTRKKGEIPGVVYGPGRPATPIWLSRRDLEKALATEMGTNVVLDLKINGEKIGPSVIKQIQRDPVGRAWLHVDLMTVRLTEKIEVRLPVHTQGESPGAKAGGTLQYVMHEVRAKCRPDRIPPALEVDISRMQIGDSLAVRQIPLPEGVEILEDPEAVVLHVAAPVRVEEELAAAAPAPQQPEVIAKGKEAEQAPEGAPAPAEKAAVKAAKKEESASKEEKKEKK